jgi:hypothetical protein
MPQPSDLDHAVDRAIADCGGDPRAAVRALIVMVQLHEDELVALHREIDRLTADLWPGYVRKNFRDRLP